jgi:hypothetical protein
VVSKFAPDGRLLAEKFIDSQTPNLDSVRVDFAGNVYLAAGLRPGRSLLPPGLRGKAPESPRDPAAVNGVNSYPLMYGSIVKFGPGGGVIHEQAGGVPCNFGPGRSIEVKGARWIFPGVSTAHSWATPKRDPGTVISCVCESPGIDVDDFARTFFPDAGRCRVGVLDTAGNLICWFGTYGNQDSTGAGGTIPLAWPQAVVADDHHAWVADRLNRRLVRVRLNYASEATCNVK